MAAEVAHRGLRKYLLPGETPVAEIRHHRIVLLKPAVAVLASLALCLWLDISVSDADAGILGYVWLLWFGVVAWAAWQWIEWRHTRVVATDKRIVLFEGWINHKVSMMPLKKVTDMGYERPLLGRILGYGTFVLESAGQDQALSSIRFVPDPDDNYRAICSVVFGMGPIDDDDEGGAPRDDELAWETSADYATRLGIVDGVYVGGGPVPDPAVYGPPPRLDSSIYRSRDLEHREHDADTGELPPYDPDAY
ncbi:PH domain-containing protein [Janibacter terrae]|uniref:PH domain-containing protein n=1 Tax=Janibacter terrae TaxID=103817 RepID=UPI00381A4E15